MKKIPNINNLFQEGISEVENVFLVLLYLYSIQNDYIENHKSDLLHGAFEMDYFLWFVELNDDRKNEDKDDGRFFQNFFYNRYKDKNLKKVIINFENEFFIKNSISTIRGKYNTILKKLINENLVEEVLYSGGSYKAHRITSDGKIFIEQNYLSISDTPPIIEPLSSPFIINLYQTIIDVKTNMQNTGIYNTGTIENSPNNSGDINQSDDSKKENSFYEALWAFFAAGVFEILKWADIPKRFSEFGYFAHLFDFIFLLGIIYFTKIIYNKFNK